MKWTPYNINIATALNRRRQELGLSCSVLARRAGVSLRTVQRVIAGKGPSPEFATVMVLAQSMGMTLRFDAMDADAMRRRQAQEKAHRLASSLQATSALEAQGLPKEALRELKERTVHELLAGSRRRLWAS